MYTQTFEQISAPCTRLNPRNVAWLAVLLVLKHAAAFADATGIAALALISPRSRLPSPARSYDERCHLPRTTGRPRFESEEQPAAATAGAPAPVAAANGHAAAEK